jgi:Concanavalin A-like lectin/glucanases superfamily
MRSTFFRFTLWLATAFLSTTLLAAPVIHWKLDDASGSTTAADSSGGGRNGFVKVPAGVIFNQPGVVGTCVQFNNTANASIRIPNTTPVTPSGPAAAGLTTYPMSVSVWMNNTTADNDCVLIVGSGGPTTGTTAFYNQANYHELHRSGALYERNSTTFQAPSIAPVVTVSNGVWHHVVGVWASATDRKLYIDGVLRGTDVDAGADHATYLVSRFGIGALDRSDASVVDNYTWTRLRCGRRR